MVMRTLSFLSKLPVIDHNRGSATEGAMVHVLFMLDSIHWNIFVGLHPGHQLMTPSIKPQQLWPIVKLDS